MSTEAYREKFAAIMASYEGKPDGLETELQALIDSMTKDIKYWKTEYRAAQDEVDELEDKLTTAESRVEELEEELESFEKGKDVIRVVVDTMEQRERLLDFVRTHIHPHFNEQKMKLDI